MIRLFRKKIFEMAYNRQVYQGFVEDLIPQIAQNWCLCKYCQLYRPDLVKTTYHHWRSELEAYLNRLNQKETKPKNNKLKWTQQIVTENNYNNADKIFSLCELKFERENEVEENRPSLGITLEQQKEVCKLFAEEINSIIECISSETSIKEYSRVIFP